MRNIVYLFLTFYAACSISSCEKSEIVTTYEELVTVQFNGLPNGTAVFRNGAEVPSSGYQSYKVPVGEATYRFEDSEGTVLMEQQLNVTEALSITVFDSGNGLLLVIPIDDVEVNPSKIKFDIANVSSFSNEEEVNLVIVRVNSQQLPAGEPDTIRNVNNIFTDEFVEIDFGGFTNETENLYSHTLIYVYDQNMDPYRIQDLPVVYRLRLGFDDEETGNPAKLHKVYKVVLKDDDSGRAYTTRAIGLFEEGMYYYSVNPLLSK